MADATITIGDELMAKLDEYAEAAGQASGEEFAKVILQREIDKLEDAGANEQIEDRLRGLGYIS
jgi:metal-responsive CopG/Arc/MetJ family transcriptional regulator